MVDTIVASGETRTTRLDMEGEDRLTVNGTFTVADQGQTVRFSAPTNGEGASVVNNGLLENTADGGRAIRFGDAVGDTLNASITNTGTIRAGDDAVQIQDGSVASGLLTVRNTASGEILAGDGQGLDLASTSGAFRAVVSNQGLIASEGNDGVRFGSLGELRNIGHIIGGRADGYGGSLDGVQLEEGADVDIVNGRGGLITGDRHGVNADEGTTVSVLNEAGGKITGFNGSGVGSDGTGAVVNYGVITGSFTGGPGTDVNGATPGEEDGGGPDGVPDGDGDGVDIDGRAAIENYGVIRGTGAGGNGSDGFANTSEGIAAGGGLIVNSEGGRIYGEGLGILIDDSSRGDAPFLTTIVNDGVIAGFDGEAIKIVSALDDVVTNNGAIKGGAGVAIEFGSGDNTLVIGDGSGITGRTIGGAGVDTLDYSNFTGAVGVNLGTGSATRTGGVDSFESVIGSNGADRILGGASDDRIEGGLGSDRLAGGAGDDTFVFASALGRGNVDRIVDFVSVDDTFELSASTFTGLTAGALAADAFVIGAQAADAEDRIVYDQASGTLLFDRDGLGGSAAVAFAVVRDGTAIDASDFTIV